ncbi:hypothetical protein Tco_0431327 [Tanacetum coccineum]
MEKGMRGLGVGSIRAKNLSLLGKCKWRFHIEDTALWRKVIKEIYGPGGGFGHMAHRGTRIGLWNEIVKSSEYIKKLEIPLDNLIVRKIASGEQTRTLWLKLWNWWKCCSTGPLSLADILLNRITFSGRSQGAVRALYGVCYVLLWSIWRWRNKLLHASSIEVDGIKHEDIFPSIQKLSLLWMSNRSGRDNMNGRD